MVEEVRRVICIVHVVCAIVCMWTFISGLFPNPPLLSRHDDGDKPEEEARAVVNGRTIFIIIDALRGDFIHQLSIAQHALSFECMAGVWLLFGLLTCVVVESNELICHMKKRRTHSYTATISIIGYGG